MSAAASLGRLLRWYPPAWRDRYGEELLVFMHDSFGPGKPPLAARASIAWGGIRERARRGGLMGDSVPVPDRVRAGVLTVLVSWAVMVLAAASFAKMTEHFDTALPHAAGAHQLPDTFYMLIQNVAAVAGLIVIGGAGLALPTLLRFLRSGGWPSIRAHALRAVIATLLTVAMTAALVQWAHHLSSSQRNGGSTGYALLFLAWAALVVASVVLWTVLGVLAAAKLTFSRTVLAVEAGFAVAVTLATATILVATSLWWILVTQNAPGYLADAASQARLLVTVLLMAIAAATATTGTLRIAQTVPEWRRH